MAVSIRFRRGGRRNRPFFRIVVADSRSPRDGKYIENLGYYDPLPDPEVVKVKEDRMVYWLLQGAIPTKSLKSILKRQGLWQKLVERVEQEKAAARTKAQQPAEQKMEENPEPQVEPEVPSEQGGNDDRPESVH